MRLVLLTFYPTDTRLVPGGIRMVSYNLVEALRDYADIELHVIHCHADIAMDVSPPLDVSHPLDRTVQDGRVTIHYLAMPRQRIVPNLVTSIGRIVREVRAIDPDLIHAHAAHFAYAGIKAGYPTIYTIHGVLPRERQIYTRTLFDRLRYGLLAYYEAYALQRVRQVVAISSHVLSVYARADEAHPADRVHPRDTSTWVRIDNPVPQAYFDLRDQTEPGRVLYMGSIDERKDLLTLLRAVERLQPAYPALRLAVAGRVNSAAYERRVRDYVAKQGLEHCVEFLGFLDRDRTMAEYARCAVLALPSLEENAPMVVIEAMAAGKPVVATRVGGVPDLVQEGETGFLVPPSDDAALAQRLGQLLDDAALRTRLGQRARQVCRARFHADNIARRYYELYCRVLGM